MLSFEIIFGFITAGLLGMLVGVERALHDKEGYAGMRTFTLISFLGALAFFISQITNTIAIFIVILALVFIIIISGYVVSARKGFFGMTTEITAFIMFCLGALVMNTDYRIYSVLLVIAIVAVLALKNVFRGFVKKTTTTELNDTIKFLIIAFVVLPVLPDAPLDILLKDVPLVILLPDVIREIFSALNLHTIWLLIVLYASSGFIGYFLMRLFGQKRGLYLNGFLGGFTSTTAVNISLLKFSRRSANVGITYPLVAVTVLANLSMLIRATVLVSFLSISLTQRIIAPIFILIVLHLILFAVIYLQASKIKQFDIDITNPLHLTEALEFGGIILSIIIASYFALKYTGDYGLYLIGAISSIFQTTGYILNIAKLYDIGELSYMTAYIAIAVVLVFSGVSKGFYNLIKANNRFSIYSFMYYIAFAVAIMTVFWTFA